ncbi:MULTISPECIES: hypothetical protein [unclassified Roseateles]|uniref:hypothetical protein n=1 Tax=unclassified Roseateles TaxID=2626991 RepID=UPI000701783D|nr:MULTISPECIES: hypothetical protein [unclassified Roseateles]KQW44667.1 hypothetical protein ASC81_13830 [Pelomonas sp. Root405]KRA70026.1 hypothetical protein ASD88_17990 [Pelomonas sp. Root662]
MLIPLHLIPVPADEPRGLGDPGHAWSGLKIAQGVHLGDIRALGLTVSGATSGGPVATADLLRFGQLMNDAGLTINPTRMLYDRHYAYERLADGHASSHPGLRDLALDLFEAYQAAGEWIGMTH